MAKSPQKRKNYRLGLLWWSIAPLTVFIVLGFFIFREIGNSSYLLAKKSYSPVQTLNSFEKVDITSGAVTLWFDDAWATQYESGFPLVEEHQFVATLAVPTTLVGEHPYMGWDEIREMASSGWEIVSHSQTHTCDIENLTFDELNIELESSKNDLLKKGIETNIYVPPCGRTNPISNSLSLYHYSYQRSVDRGFNSLPLEDPYNIKIQQIDQKTTINDIERWINKAQNENLWLILMFHQIDSERREYSASKTMLKKILNTIKRSGIQVANPNQIL